MDEFESLVSQQTDVNNQREMVVKTKILSTAVFVPFERVYSLNDLKTYVENLFEKAYRSFEEKGIHRDLVEVQEQDNFRERRKEFVFTAEVNDD